MTAIFVDAGQHAPSFDAPGVMYPIRKEQDTLPISRQDWTGALEQWGRGVGIAVLLPLLATEPDPQRREIVSYLKSARQAIDRGDYRTAIADARKALELLRLIDGVSRKLPDTRHRSVDERIHAIIQALYDLASAPSHTDEAVRDFEPTRADATAVVAGAASVAQQVFARLDR